VSSSTPSRSSPTASSPRGSIKLFERAPLLRSIGIPGAAAHPVPAALARVEALALHELDTEAPFEHTIELLASPHLAQLRRFEVTNGRLDDRGGRALRAAGAARAAALARAGRLPGVEPAATGRAAAADDGRGSRLPAPRRAPARAARLRARRGRPAGAHRPTDLPLFAEGLPEGIIKAIIDYRERTGVGLAVGKTAVERIARRRA